MSEIPGTTPASPGRAAYEAYATVSGGKSLISGAPLPGWDEQRPEIREAWRAAADAAVMYANLLAGHPVTGDGVDIRADNRDLRHLNTSQASRIRDLTASLSSLTDRAEAGKVITGDEADEYRSLIAAPVPVPDDEDDDTPGYWQVRAALSGALHALQIVALGPDGKLAAMAKEALAKANEVMADGCDDSGDACPVRGESGTVPELVSPAYVAALEEDLDAAGATIAEYRGALGVMQSERDRLADALRSLASGAWRGSGDYGEELDYWRGCAADVLESVAVRMEPPSAATNLDPGVLADLLSLVGGAETSPDKTSSERLVLCPGCLHDGVLDRVTDQLVRAETKLAEVRSVLLEGGQDAPTARRRALAIISTGEAPGNKTTSAHPDQS